METMFWIWMAAALVFLIIEIGVPGLVFVCFAVGSVGAAIYAEMRPAEYLIQIGIFAVITIVLVPMTRKFAKKISLESAPGSNVDALVGQPAIVVKAIDPVEDVGQVRIQGEVWSATADAAMPHGAKVTVTGVKGNRLIVRRGIDGAAVSEESEAPGKER